MFTPYRIAFVTHKKLSSMHFGDRRSAAPLRVSEILCGMIGWWLPWITSTNHNSKNPRNHCTQSLCPFSLVFLQPPSQVFSRSVRTGRREPWERGCSFWSGESPKSSISFVKISCINEKLRQPLPEHQKHSHNAIWVNLFRSIIQDVMADFRQDKTRSKISLRK